MKIGNWKLKIVFTLLFFFLCVNTASAVTTISKSLSRPINNLGLVGWWTFDGPDMLTNVADKSGQGNNGSLSHGGSGTTTAPGPIGQALSFDGTDDYVNTVNINALESGDMSFSFWTKLNGAQTTRWFMNQWETSDQGPAIFLDTDGTLSFEIGAYFGGRIDTATVFPSNVWKHVVATASGNTLTLYIDGTQSVQGNVTRTESTASSVFTIAGPSEGGVSTLKGSLDDIRVYNRALSAAEITRLYQIGATSKIAKTLPGRDSLTSGLVGWWTMDGPDMLTNVADKSGQGNNGSLSHGGSGTTTAPGPIGQALVFDGVNDYATFSSFTKPTDFSYSMWLYLNASQSGFATILEFGNDSPWFGIQGTNGKLQLYLDNPLGATVLSTGVWYHAVLTSAGGVSKIYLNGVQDGGNGTGNTATTAGFGLAHNIDDGYFNGKIDDVRIYNRALSAAEITRLYQIGATSKIAKTLPGRDSLTSGLVGWWTFDGPDTLTNIADKSGQGNTGKLILGASGNTSTTTAPGPVGQALSFDGADDLITTPLVLSNSAPYTVSVWVRFTGSAVGEIFSQDSTGTDDISLTYTPGTGFGFESETDAHSVDTLTGFGSTALDRNWHHVVVVEKYTTDVDDNDYYVDGVIVVSTSGALGNPANTTFVIGNRGAANAGWNGSLDDVRVYNRALSAAEVLQLYNLGR